ncbi:MAG: TrbI/VirB10 family protein, partial [Desulfovibrionaceae bacterium]|nr:TrbI/VirB10 family protein [Desulfovibrionaceae bacterium]
MESPNSFEPSPPADVVKMHRWPLYAVILAGLFLLGILVYSVNFAHDPEEEAAESRKVDIQEQENPLLMGEGQGLSLQPPPGSPAVATPPPPANSKPEPIIVVRDETKKPSPHEQEMDNIRRMRSQAYLSALSSPLAVKKANVTAGAAPTGTAQADPSSASRAAGNALDASALRENGYDPAADKDKEAFFDRANMRDSAWILPHSRTSGQTYELKTGAVIPGVMVTGINSDLPGSIIAQVSQNVFDTATGQYLLIPRGARLYGIYDSRVVYGQKRVLVAWNRLIFPDGSAVTLGAMPGADMSGFAGYADKVDSHYAK